MRATHSIQVHAALRQLPRRNRLGEKTQCTSQSRRVVYNGLWQTDLSLIGGPHRAHFWSSGGFEKKSLISREGVMDKWNELPKFLFLENYDEDWLGVMHCHTPRFIMEFTGNGDEMEESGEVVVWLDSPDHLETQELEDIMADACDFYYTCTSNDEDMDY